jgi:hypothetical protein
MDFPSGTGLRLIFLFILGSCALVLKFVLDSRRVGLSHIPGPFLARYTDAWRLYQAVKGYGKPEYLSNRLRKKYGEVARIGPDMVAVFDPAAVSTIYGTSSRLNKVWFSISFATTWGLQVPLLATSLGIFDGERSRSYSESP